MNEDDTFNKLRRPSFLEIYHTVVRIQVEESDYYNYLRRSVEVLKANHWTVEEYGIALKKKFQDDNK
jgi:hypothetical protein